MQPVTALLSLGKNKSTIPAPAIQSYLNRLKTAITVLPFRQCDSLDGWADHRNPW